MKTPNQLIQEVLPEATQGDAGKWYYNDWVIYYGAGFIGNRKTQDKVRFGNLQGFERALMRVK